jgi:hypothetical protein
VSDFLSHFSSNNTTLYLNSIKYKYNSCVKDKSNATGRYNRDSLLYKRMNLYWNVYVPWKLQWKTMHDVGVRKYTDALIGHPSFYNRHRNVTSDGSYKRCNLQKYAVTITQKGKKPRREWKKFKKERKLYTTCEHFLQVDRYVTQGKHAIAAPGSCSIGQWFSTFVRPRAVNSFFVRRGPSTGPRPGGWEKLL